jgi:hypothetical protein
MIEVDLSNKTDNQIEIWIQNYEKRHATGEAFYKKLLEERAKRQTRGLKLEVSLQNLIVAAKARQFVTYGDLAKASEVPWNAARHSMNGVHGHLDRLLDICHARGFPLLTALCVNQGGAQTGELGEHALKGFVNGAKRLGYTVTDASAFLRDCQ